MAPKQNWIQQAKAQKPLLRGDIPVYIALAALIVGLFWVFVFSRPNLALGGIQILHEQRGQADVVVFAYDTASGEYSIDPAWQQRVDVTPAGDGLDVTLHTENRFNRLHISADGRSYMEDADCSFHKDCVSFPAIAAADDVIICVPHNLTVLGVGQPDAPPVDDEPIIG